jgi:LysR family glycine cleavage system transcriptional activator
MLLYAQGALADPRLRALHDWLVQEVDQMALAQPA